ncbi:unnamed protein product, partial [Notodromas monacha]
VGVGESGAEELEGHLHFRVRDRRLLRLDPVGRYAGVARHVQRRRHDTCHPARRPSVDSPVSPATLQRHLDLR